MKLKFWRLVQYIGILKFGLDSRLRGNDRRDKRICHSRPDRESRKFAEGLIQLVVLLGIGSLLTSAAQAEILKFKMTDKQIPLLPGFKRVTAATDYAKELGYGWSKGERAEWKICEFGAGEGRKYMTGTFPDIITGSWVAPGKFVGTTYVSAQYDFAGVTEFRIDAPPGKYWVYLILGDYYYNSMYLETLRRPYSVGINGKELVSVKLAEPEVVEYFYQHEYEDYNPALPYWRKYVKPYFERTTYKLTAESDGSLRIAVSNIPVAMIAVWPEAEKAQAEKWLQELEVEREKSCEFKEKERPASGGYQGTAEEKARGYALFAADYMIDVMPYTAPEEKDLKADITLFTAPNEFEPATFAIYPLKDLKDVSVKVKELKNAAGDVFPAQNIDVQWVKYMEMPIIEGSLLRYEVKPQLLIHRDKTDAYQGIPKQCWLEIFVPEGTKPGNYKGEVEVTAGNAPAGVKKVVLKVLPFRLKTLTELDKYIDLTISYIYERHPGIWPGTDAKSMSAKLMKAWNDYGFNMGQANFGVISCYPLDSPHDFKLVDGKVVVDFANCEAWLKGWEQAGIKLKAVVFTGLLNGYTQGMIKKKVPGYRETKNEVKEFPEGYDDVFMQLAKVIDQEFTKRGWPTPIFYEGGEGGGYEEGQYFEKYVHGLCKKAGVKNSLSLSGDMNYFKEIVPLVWMPFDYYFNLEKYEWLKEHKYNMVFKATFNRFERGLFFWRIKAMGHHAETFCYAGFGVPYIPVSSPWDSGGICLPSRDGNGIHPYLFAERDVREGHDDARYLFQLEEMIQEALKSGKEPRVKAAQEAQATLEKIAETVNPDLDNYRIKGAYPSPSIYGKIRWRVAREMIKLQEALGK